MKYFFLGSLPYQNVEDALRFVDEASPSLPFLPQLPELGEKEDMFAQVLKGFDAGGFDDECCACFTRFMTKYAGAKEMKIQVAGPFSLARVISADYDSIWRKWFLFIQSLFRQLEGMGVSSKIWLQIDEPSWNRSKALPADYRTLICSLRGMKRGTKVGVHTCAEDRPVLTAEFLSFADFVSLNFLSSPIDVEETQVWRQVWKLSPTRLVAGVIGPGNTPRQTHLQQLAGEKNVIMAAACGLSDWSEEEMKKSFYQ